MDLDYLSFAGIPVNFELQASTPLISLQAGVSHVSNLVAGPGGVVGGMDTNGSASSGCSHPKCL